MAQNGPRLIGTILSFTLISRAIGIAREALIAAGFGFTRATDAFYQLAATPTYLMVFLGGPFSTAYIAWSNRSGSPDQADCAGVVARWLAFAVAALCAVFLAIGLTMARSARAALLPPLLMALAIMATGLIGLGVAIANARGQFVRAQAILFVNNAAFVALLGLGALLLRARVELALTAAFCGAALIAAAYAYAVSLASAPGISSPQQRSAAQASAVQVFVPMLGMAGAETLGFLASQAFVLWLASGSGAGVTSAGSLAQRIALTANGLVIGPLANVAMVRLIALEQAGMARAYLLRVSAMALGGLALTAAGLSAGAVLVGAYSRAASLTLLCHLIPAYAVWLVAQGGNILLNRLSFARGAARSYTAVTLAGYALANVARYAVWRSSGFAPAIAVGAAVELTAVLVVVSLTARENRPAFAAAPAR